MKVLWVLIVLAVAVLLLTGCSGSGPLIPKIERPLTADETTHILALADMIDEAGERWAPHSKAVRDLLSKGRIGVGRLRDSKKDAHATWHPRQSSIIIDPRFWRPELYDIDRAGVLVIEACHVLRAAVSDCDAKIREWEQDYFLMTVLKREVQE